MSWKVVRVLRGLPALVLLSWPLVACGPDEGSGTGSDPSRSLRVEAFEYEPWGGRAEERPLYLISDGRAVLSWYNYSSGQHRIYSGTWRDELGLRIIVLDERRILNWDAGGTQPPIDERIEVARLLILSGPEERPRTVVESLGVGAEHDSHWKRMEVTMESPATIKTIVTGIDELVPEED